MNTLDHIAMWTGYTLAGIMTLRAILGLAIDTVQGYRKLVRYFCRNLWATLVFLNDERKSK